MVERDAVDRVPALIAASPVRALGFGADGSAWLLLGDGRAETIGGACGSWQALPPVPPGTVTLAPSGTVTLAPSGRALSVPNMPSIISTASSFLVMIYFLV